MLGLLINLDAVQAAILDDIVKGPLYMTRGARLWRDEPGPAYDAKLQQCVLDRLAASQGTTTQPSPAPSTHSSPRPAP